MKDLIKQLVESQISDYLEESYDDIIESIMNEVSEETWEAIEEAILNELSPDLLDRYADKALSQSIKLKKQVYGKKKVDSSTVNKYHKRDAGFRLASRKTNALAPGAFRSAKVKAKSID